MCESKIDIDWNIPVVRIGALINANTGIRDPSGISPLPLLIQQLLSGDVSSLEEVRSLDTSVSAIVKYMLDHGAALGGVAEKRGMLVLLADHQLPQTLNVLLESSQC